MKEKKKIQRIKEIYRNESIFSIVDWISNRLDKDELRLVHSDGKTYTEVNTSLSELEHFAIEEIRQMLPSADCMRKMQLNLSRDKKERDEELIRETSAFLGQLMKLNEYPIR